MARLSFHSFPDVKTEKGKLWIAKIRRDPGRVNSNTKVCSLHFTVHDYIGGDDAVQAKRSVLKVTAVPTVFPWTVEKHIRTSMTSKMAISSYQRRDIEPVEERHLICDDNPLGFEINDGSESDVASEIKCQCEEMKKKIEELQCRVSEAENKLKRSLFRFENIKDDDEMVKFYTGIPDQAAFYEEILEDDAKAMRLWVGKKKQR